MGKGIFNILIILALMLAGATIFLVKLYVDSQVAAAKQQAPKVEKIEMQKILVAKLEILPGVEITQEMVETKEIPVSINFPGVLRDWRELRFVPQQVSAKDKEGNVLMEDVTKPDGKVVKEPKMTWIYETKRDELRATRVIPVGDVILMSKLDVLNRMPRPSQALKNGERLISLNYSAENAGAGLIRIGDRVDIMGYVTVGNGDDEEIASRLILQNVEVFDIVGGEVTNEPAVDPGDNKKKGNAPKNVQPGTERKTKSNTVTLKVSTDQALRIYYLRQGFEFNLLLRSPLDTEIVRKVVYFEFDFEDEMLGDGPIDDILSGEVKVDKSGAMGESAPLTEPGIETNLPPPAGLEPFPDNRDQNVPSPPSFEPQNTINQL